MTLKVAVVGFGSAGRQHAAAVEPAEGVRLVAVVDADPGADTGTHRRYDAMAELLADPDIGLVALCLPPGGRAEPAHDVLRAGKALLVEKPPAMTVGELDRLTAHAGRRSLPAGVMLQHRMRLAAQIAEGGWDAPCTTAVLEVSRHRPAEHYRDRDWRGRPDEALGGIVAHLGIHYLDLACQLLGEPVEVRATGHRERLPGIDSRIAAAVSFDTGATLSLTVSSESSVRGERLAVYGPDRRLVIEDGEVTITSAAGRSTTAAEPTPVLRRRVYEEMARSARAGRAPATCALARSRGVTWLLGELAAGPRVAQC